MAVALLTGGGMALAGGEPDPDPAQSATKSDDGGEGHTRVPADSADQGHDMAEKLITVPLTGGQVPGGAGDAGGSGTAELTFKPAAGQMCFDMTWSGLGGDVTAIHLHKGPQGVNGGHHFDLFNDTHLVGSDNHVLGCVSVTDPAAGDHASHAGAAGGSAMGSGMDSVGDHGTEHDAQAGFSASHAIQAIIGSPAEYYLNIHSSEHDKGAIRGQLG